ncbi:hypothetical protein GGQ84_001577 [Desulfitispora alkaliphila]|uniref:GatB/YqeY domain-containing protein n=1 Tax=Desulfitispora alkaliphila TaxID=622674 RepID=UPI003D240B4C
MSLKDRLMNDMKASMKLKQEGKEKLAVIRMVRAAVKNKEIDLKRDLNEDEVTQVISKEVKQRKDAIDEYEKAGREDIVAKLRVEIDILNEYLPQQLTAEEVEAIAQGAIAETGATSAKDMGKVMKAIMPKVSGRADGKIVNKIVQQLLN